MKSSNLFKTTTSSRRLLVAVAAVMASGFVASAQIDPAPRQILHLGANASLRDDGPMGAYAFYYWNMPNVPTTNEVLRFAIAPCYVDGDLGFKGLITEHTDLAVGAFGGLFANNYNEVDAGKYKKDESFEGDGGGARVSIYHLLNPGDRIPLTLVLRESLNYDTFARSGDTSDKFSVPNTQPVFVTRAGLRFGGKEPYLAPTLGMEVSAWYEMANRMDSGTYGYANDRRLEATTQRVFGRAQINYTTLESQHYIVLSVQGGALFNPDRLGAYRMGGVLPYTKEFPLMIPGYYYSELSAQDYGLVNAAYTIPLGSEKRWSIITEAAAAVVKYIDGTGQPGAFNSGVGAGIGYTAPSRRWKLLSLFGYGFEAEREHGRGGYTLGAAFEYNFGSTQYAGHKAWEELQQADEEEQAGVTH